MSAAAPSAWDAYPADYRSAEISAVLAAVRAGECFAIIGLSGAGKSNLLGFLEHRALREAGPRFFLADCNRLAQPTADGFFSLIGEVLGSQGLTPPGLGKLESLAAVRLAENPQGLCLLIDRFDALDPTHLSAVSGGLRALRDRFKYALTYGIATRRPLDPRSELAELLYAHTFWLGPLNRADAIWSAGQYAARRGIAWDAPTLEFLVDLTWGYPSLLRAACEAHASGAPLEPEALRGYPAVRRRIDEFWADAPSAEDLRRSRLAGHPLLAQGAPLADLTAAEQRLLDALRARPGQLCAKDDLIRAVWPEEVLVLGLRDDSLAQLVHRLREKIEPDPSHPRYIHTVPGRGYRFTDPPV